ncbi:MAG: hypothetical protein Tsb007_00380 [Rhizobacter sp.]
MWRAGEATKVTLVGGRGWFHSVRLESHHSVRAEPVEAAWCTAPFDRLRANGIRTQGERSFFHVGSGPGTVSPHRLDMRVVSAGSPIHTATAL